VFIPVVHEDDRGFFKETYARNRYTEHGLPDTWFQDSMSWSTRNVLRGVHYDFRMAKLVQCVRGRMYDVIVDLRRESLTYLKWQGFYLSESNHKQLFVPPGFGHSFLALADEVAVTYKNSVQYDPSSEGGISWRNPQVGIVWPLVGDVRMSAKDAAVPLDFLP
jgi:dTDP-4-dehydrorhamnose 3,5-epimerase